MMMLEGFPVNEGWGLIKIGGALTSVSRRPSRPSASKVASEFINAITSYQIEDPYILKVHLAHEYNQAILKTTVVLSIRLEDIERSPPSGSAEEAKRRVPLCSRSNLRRCTRF